MRGNPGGGGQVEDYGTASDPLILDRVGGIKVFGGGLALYSPLTGNILGGVGVSGDTSYADHNIAWKTRFFLNLDNVPGGISSTNDDNIIYDITLNAQGHPVSASGFGHPECSPEATAIGKALPIDFPVGLTPAL